MRYEEEEPYVIIEKHEGSIGSLLLGVAIGAGLALLFAPRSGLETRQEIGRRARRAQDAAVDLANGVTETVVDTLHEAKHRVEARLDDARQAIDFKRQQVVRAMDAGRAAAQTARDELERRIAETKAAYQAGTEVARGVEPGGASPAARPATRGMSRGVPRRSPAVATSGTASIAGTGAPGSLTEGVGGAVGPTGSDETNVEL